MMKMKTKVDFELLWCSFDGSSLVLKKKLLTEHTHSVDTQSLQTNQTTLEVLARRIVVINLVNRPCYGCLCLSSQIQLGSPLELPESRRLDDEKVFN